MEKPTFVMMVGLPGSGKSTLAKDMAVEVIKVHLVSYQTK